MATRIVYSSSAEPIVTVPLESYQDNAATETTSYEIQQSVGGTGTVACTFALVDGFAAGVRTLYSAAVSGGAIAYPWTNGTAYKFICIKHTGYVYSSGSVLGVASGDNLNVYYYNNSVVTCIASVPPGGTFMIPVGSSVDFSDVYFGYRSSSAALTIAVERLAVT